MSRRKQANKRNWNTINKQREEQNKPTNEEDKTETSQKEHEEKIKMLKEIGLLKD